MQVGRFLEALDPAVRVTLVTTPIAAGWQREDCSLKIDRPGMNVIATALPFHRLTQRVLANRRLTFLHRPDSGFWLTWFAKYILQRLPDTPDVIYSRSAPFSAAMLARRLKSITGRPWLMHLSDPWSGSPYRQFSERRTNADRAQEARCFADADMITLTTQGQANHYRARYLERDGAIDVTPNMMPLAAKPVPVTRQPGKLRLVYTGAIYGDRDPGTLLAAMRYLHDKAPEVTDGIRVDFYGNMSTVMAKRIGQTPGCFVHGPVSYAFASKLMAEADVLLSVEPDGDNPLLLHFLLSKIVDYLASGKPILAITLPGSETDRLCRAGYGWSIAPGDTAAMAAKLSELVAARRAGEVLGQAEDPRTLPYQAEMITSDILRALKGLAKGGL